jgi:hypothetical protein
MTWHTYLVSIVKSSNYFSIFIFRNFQAIISRHSQLFKLFFEIIKKTIPNWLKRYFGILALKIEFLPISNKKKYKVLQKQIEVLETIYLIDNFQQLNSNSNISQKWQLF